MENRNAHLRAQLLFDVEAVRRPYILQIDPAESGLQAFDRTDEFIRVGRVDLDIEDIDVGEALE